MEKICQNCEMLFIWIYDKDQKYCDNCICHVCKGEGGFNMIVDHEGREMDKYRECPDCRGEGHI